MEEKEEKKEKEKEAINKKQVIIITFYARQNIYKTVIAFHLFKLINIEIGGFKKEKEKK